MIVSPESDEGDCSPLYLILITEGAVPPSGPVALTGELFAGDLIGVPPPFLPGDD